MENDLPQQNIRFADAIKWFHFAYMTMYIPCCFLDPQSILARFFAISFIGNLFAFCIIRIHWDHCPLTMIENAYRYGKEQNCMRWKKYRETLSFNKTCFWTIFNAVFIWTTFQIIAVFVFVRMVE